MGVHVAAEVRGPCYVSQRVSGEICSVDVGSQVLRLESRPAPLYNARLGEVSEWLKEPVSKTGGPVWVSWVRIPPSPSASPGRPRDLAALSSRRGSRPSSQQTSQGLAAIRPDG